MGNNTEIGGYIEFEHYHGPMLYEDGIHLDSGRSCLKYLFRAKRIQRIMIPSLMCDTVFDVCREENVQIRTYQISENFRPPKLQLEHDEYLYLMNYYGQLSNEEIKAYAQEYRRVIVDNTQAYFAEPVENTDTFYTCRKYFGVPDGAILYTDAKLEGDLERSESFQHMTHLLGRYERSGSDFYAESIQNNKRLAAQPIRSMSLLTENLLHSYDYSWIEERRRTNYIQLHTALGGMNRVLPIVPVGPFAYPLICEHGEELRKEMIRRKVYVPTLWPNVIADTNVSAIDRLLVLKLLPIPCDQRYSEIEMRTIIDIITSFFEKDER